jgi:hypothetical protein
MFRKFLFAYGSDISRPRDAFVKLTTIYNRLEDPSMNEWSEVLQMAAEYFPFATEAVSLKSRLASIPPLLSPSACVDRTWAIASFLLTSEKSDAYANVRFDFAGAASVLWKEKRKQTVGMLGSLVQQKEKAAALSFAEGIARSVDVEALRDVAGAHRELVPIIVKLNHALAYHSDVWSLDGYLQSQVYETLTSASLSEVEWGKIVGAMFVAATYVSVRDAVKRAGACAMFGAFRWLEQDIAKQALPSQAWREALGGPAIATLRHDHTLEPAQLALAAWCAPSEEALRVLSGRRADVQRLSFESPEVVPIPLRNPTAFLLLTIGLSENTQDSAQLVFKNVFAVHEALASGDRSSESWWFLAPYVSSIGWWRDWDRCKRLRRTVRKFAEVHQVEHLLQLYATSDEDRRLARMIVRIENSSSETVD